MNAAAARNRRNRKSQRIFFIFVSFLVPTNFRQLPISQIIHENESDEITRIPKECSSFVCLVNFDRVYFTGQ